MPTLKEFNTQLIACNELEVIYNDYVIRYNSHLIYEENHVN